MIKRLYIAILSLILFLLLIYPKSVFANDIIDDWIEDDNLPYEIASHNLIGYGSGLFLIGGATGDDTANIIQSFQDINGGLGDWNLLASLPESRYWGSSSQIENKIYFLGGEQFSSGVGTEKDTVYLSVISNDGNLSAWQSVNPLPDTRALGASVIVNNRIYYAGGFNSSGRHDDIFYADINPDGTLGPWITSSTSLPLALYGFGMVEYNGNIYVIGGSDAANNSQNKVYKSNINIIDGSLSEWIELSALPLTVYRGSASIINNQIISIGGEHGSGAFFNNIFYADILPDGSISSWKESESSLPIPISSASVAIVGDYLYITGGLTTGYNYLDKVYFTKIDNSINLDVLTYKQYDPLWGNDVYDSANLWASDAKFERWGCAVTSAAMVFDYFGLDEIENGKVLTPGSLNTWLKSQQDGYIRNGSTNWLALSRLSRQISDLNSVDFNALEFSRKVSSDLQLIKDGVDNKIPSILREPGHFVVGKGYIDENILINDPFYDRNDLTEYGNTFDNISQFTPSNTDLSYMMLVIDEDINIKAVGDDNNEIGLTIIESPLDDPAEFATSSAKLLKVVYIQKPLDGNYRIEVSSSNRKDYVLEVYLYDVNGNYKKLYFNGKINNESYFYKIHYNKEGVEDSLVEEFVLYDQLIKSINTLYDQKEIRLGAFINISTKIRLAHAFQNTNKIELKLLKDLKNTIKNLNKSKQISNYARDYLIKRIDILMVNI